jgi:Holliday junction DNA helicase RuvA
MIAFVQGEVLWVEDDAAVIDVGGIGYRVHLGLRERLRTCVGEVTRLYTEQVVREDAVLLYGFSSDEERRLFVLLQSAAGVGPKLALQILSTLDPHTVVHAIAQEDSRRLTAVSGVGTKTAQRLILELRDRLGVLATAFATTPDVPESGAAGAQRDASPPAASIAGDVVLALVALGYSESEASDCVARLAGEWSDVDVATAVRGALTEMSAQRVIR